MNKKNIKVSHRKTFITNEHKVYDNDGNSGTGDTYDQAKLAYETAAKKTDKDS